MWIRFDFLCDSSTQHQLHQAARPHIREWLKAGLAKDAVLTYHFHGRRRPNDSLYLCLNIPSVVRPSRPQEAVPERTRQAIPAPITSIIHQLCDKQGISVSYDESHAPPDRLQVFDYEFQVERGVAQGQYGRVVVQDVLRYASVGTSVALAILLEAGDCDQNVEHGPQLAKRISAMIVEELGADYAWIGRARHFASNSLLMEPYEWLHAGFSEF